MAWLLLAYLAGSVPFGYLVGRGCGKDPRKEGSGNIGATNVSRVAGWRAGLLVLILDMGKGVLAVWGVGHVAPALAAYAAIAAVAGHVFPVFLGFRLGKGVATSGAVFLYLLPVPTLAALGVWALVFRLGRRISLASISAAAALPPAVLLGVRPLPRDLLVMILVLPALIILKHHQNIGRLLRGEEPCFSWKKKDLGT